MRSVIIDFDRQSLSAGESAEPFVSNPCEVKFRLHEVGVCGTDRELAHFRLKPRPNDALRIVIGHEAFGQVVECGSAVTDLWPGDWVVPAVRRPCASGCSSCTSGRPDLCLTYGYSERGIFNLDGYFTEYAVDDGAYLVRVPETLVDYGVLIEPMSIVEKCAVRIEAVRQSDGRKALVLGLGPVGLLAAMVLQLRGYEVSVYSMEPEDHPRVDILRLAGIPYTRSLDGRWDVIVEAAGSAELVLAAVRLLGSCGVFVTLGAHRAEGEFSFLDLIVGNQTLLGIVNASRQFFEDAARDLPLLPEASLRRMIRRYSFSDFRATLYDRPAGEPKSVHVIADSLN